MSADQWENLETIFHGALQRMEHERAAYIRERAAGDETLVREVESLLAAHADSTLHDSAPHDDWAGRRVGDYRIVREIGRGGMGAIYLAVRDDDAFRKQVAIKVIKRGMDSDAIVRRFRNERQILADLDHPNIARILDGGSTDDGLPFFVMEHIDGQSLDRYCSDLPLAKKLELFATVCDAVAYAQANGVIHRDLKPSNILATKTGTVKLLDFGIAKVIDDTANDTLTALGDRVLTPAYASPEQVTGQRVTATSDVYSLGVVLREIVGPKPPRNIARLIAGATARDASHRYQTARELGDNVARVRRGEPARKRTNRKWVYVAAAVVVVLASVSGGTAWRNTNRRATAVRRAALPWTGYNPADVTIRIREAERGVAVNPNSADAWAELARRRASAHWMRFDPSDANRARAEEAARRAMALAPQSEGAHGAACDVAYYIHRDYDAALREARWVLRRRPNDARVYVMFGYVQRRRSQMAEAVMTFRRAAALAPGDASNYAHIGFTTAHLRRYDESEQAFRKALELAPDSSDLLGSLAEVRWMRGGRLDDALPLLAPIHDDVNVNSMAGTVRYRYHLYARRFRDAAAAIESSPVTAYVLDDLSNSYMPRDLLVGDAYAFAGDTVRAHTRYEAARAHLVALIELNRDDALLHSALAMVYAGLGDEQQARAEATISTTLMPPSKDWLVGMICVLHRAKVEARLGMTSEAIADIQWLFAHPAPITPALLRLDPAWDRIRSDVRFQQLAKGAA